MDCSTPSLPVPHHLPEIYSLRKDNWEKDVLYLSSKLSRHWTKTGVSGIIDQLLWSLSTPLLQRPSLQTRMGDRKCTVVKFATPWTEPARLLCSWDFPGKNTGVGCDFLLQGGLPDPRIEPTSASPALQADSLPPGKASYTVSDILSLDWDIIH